MTDRGVRKIINEGRGTSSSNNIQTTPTQNLEEIVNAKVQEYQHAIIA